MRKALSLFFGPYLDGLWTHFRKPLLTSILAVTVGLIKRTVDLFVLLPADLQKANLWTAPSWVWIGVAVALFCYAQFRMWMDEHISLENEQSDHQYTKRFTAAEVDGLKRDLSLRESLTQEINARHELNINAEQQKAQWLSARVTDLTAMVGRPYVTLSFKDVNFVHDIDEPGVQCEDRTEFVATCSGKDAFGVFICPIKIGSVTLNGRIEVEKIPCGESRKLEYVLLNYDEGYQAEVVNLRFWGRLRQLFDEFLRDSGETQLNLPITIRYRDVSGCSYETDLSLFYHPQLYGTPIISVLKVAAGSST